MKAITLCMSSLFFHASLFGAAYASDQSPDAFIHRLHTQEHRPKYLFRLSEEQKQDMMVERSLHSAKLQMEKHGFAEYYDYFVKLASSPLSDEEKIKKPLVMIPPIAQLAEAPKEDRQSVFDEIYEKSGDGLCYSLNRLLYAALVRANSNLNKEYYGQENTVLLRATGHNDVPLMRLLLKHGANPNLALFDPARRPLNACQSLEAAQLLLNSGCNFEEQNKGTDLIDRFFCPLSSPAGRPSSILKLFLQHAKKDDNESFGKLWFSSLALFAQSMRFDHLIERTSILLEEGCRYEFIDKQRILRAIEDKRRLMQPEESARCNARKLIVLELFKQYQDNMKEDARL